MERVQNCFHREKVKPYYEPVINLPWEENWYGAR